MAEETIEDIKSTLRDTAKALRARLSSADRAEASKEAVAHFLDGVHYDKSDIIALFWPIRDEIDSKPLLLALMDAGQTVCLPRVVAEDAPLVFRIWEPDTALFEAGFGALAPGENAPAAEPDIIVIPLLGFDGFGTRLGYGRGYYDRTIAGMSKKPLLVGYAFAIQELPAIPRAAHDVPLDLIVTEAGVRHCSN